MSDLTFLLLIVFVVTVPVLEYQTDVTPPEMNTAERIQDDRKPLIIDLDRQGRIFLQREVMPMEILASRLAEERRQRPEVAAIIRADGERPYRQIVDIMRTIRRAGILEIKLATQPEA
ncbi:MAG: biopolymer transporter ExbD [Lentisphaerae bacterium]|nr:biopolymer transporter ExbD [Lentisphaerota bacterium]